MSKDFTPALGRLGATRHYDRLLALFTRERRWRSASLAELAPAAGDVVVDVGCGTGTLAIALKAAEPACRVVGVDPDPEALAIACSKSDLDVEWVQAMGDRAAEVCGEGAATKASISLVLHQCETPVKRAILAGMFALLRPGGKLLVTDYGVQRGLMRLAFLSIRLTDGFSATGPNAAGMLPGLIAEAGFADVRETYAVRTPTGRIALYAARRP